MATAYSDSENGVEDNTEEVLIKYYFYRGYQYKDILDLLGTLSIDDGNGNGDGEIEERLRRGRGCVAKLEAVKQAQ